MQQLYPLDPSIRLSKAFSFDDKITSQGA